MRFRLLIACGVGITFASCHSYSDNIAKLSAGSKTLDFASLESLDKWVTFRNNKNHFEFKKPACFGFYNNDPENEPQDSNVVIVVNDKKCGNGSELSLTFRSLSTDRVDLDKVLSAKVGMVTREIDLNGSRGVITAERLENKGCSRWRTYSHCNGRNMSIEFTQCMGDKKFAALEKGIGEPEPVIKAMLGSYKCLVK